MKLFGLFATAALATNEGDRMFANEVSFFNNIPAEDSRWETDSDWVLKRREQILDATNYYFSPIFIPDNRGAQRVADNMKRELQKTLYMTENKAKSRNCQDATGRKRRDVDRFVIEQDWSHHKAMAELFTNYARYARNELQRNCPKKSMVMLKRIDRLRQIWYWQSCRPQFGINPSGQACSWAYVIDSDTNKAPESPRKTQNKYNRETNVKFTSTGCQGPTELVCPTGGTIEVVDARYGRRSSSECGKNAVGETTKCWSKAGQVLTEAAAACNGESSCNFDYQDDTLCPGVDKYSRVHYICKN